MSIVILIGAVQLLQNRLIYVPHRYSIEALNRAAEVHSVTLWPTPDEGYRGLVSARPPAPRGTLVVFHGNGGSALDRLHYVAALERLGFKVILAEHPGYGARTGRLNEQAFVADAKTTVRMADRDFGGPLYVWGESLGCGVATAVAADPGLPVEGLALITPFASLPDLAQSIYGFLPVKWLIRDKYDSVANLRGFRKPVAVLVAGSDELIPSQQPLELYDSLVTQKKMWVFEGSGHNSWPISPAEPWWQEVADFISGEPSIIPGTMELGVKKGDIP